MTNGIHEPDMEKARQIAAQCWCDEETKDIVMDWNLAEAFARRLTPLLARTTTPPAPSEPGAEEGASDEKPSEAK